jgi:hypothetical protein
MYMLAGVLILVVISIGIIYLRKTVESSNNSTLKTAMKIGDYIIWIRFIFFIVFFGGILVYAKLK